jgi:O-succinylbenzoic acid--CoA ligase
MFQEFDQSTTASVFWKTRVTKSYSKLALHFGHRHLTWAELDQQLAIIVRNLVQAGITSNTVVALVGKLSIDQYLIYLACLKSGTLCAVLNDDDSVEDLTHKLATLQCDVVIAPKTESTLAMGHTRIDSYRLLMGTQFQCIDLDSNSSQPFYSSAATSENPTIASIVFTSGTTAKPKAVAHSVYNHLVSAAGVCEEMQLSETDNWMLSLPLYHVSGIAILWRWLACGGQITLPIKRQHQLEDHNFERVTVISWVTTQLQAYLASDNINKNLKVLLGGSHFSDSLIAGCRVKGVMAWLGYGFTEAASTVCAKKLDESNTVGRCLMYRVLKLEGNEICVKSDALAMGYLDNGQLIKLPLIEGYFHTADLGEWVDTQLKIIGRKGNMYISGGENIHCEEVEAAIKRIEGVLDVIVIPIDDARFGKVGVAVIDCDDLDSHSRYQHALSHTLARFKHPKYFIKLPQNYRSNGIKLPRNQLAQWLKANPLLLNTD